MADNQPTNEQWLPVVGWEGFYEVSDLGRIRSVARIVIRSDGRKRTVYAKDLQPHTTRYGYRVAGLYRGNKGTNAPVHRLVLEAFVGPCPDGMEACHGNGVRDDNRLENLRWDTRKANVADMLNHGTQNNQAKTHCPRGHLLDHPNLRPADLPSRKCLACSRARGYAKHHGMLDQLQQVSDGYYRSIMAGTWVDGRKSSRAA